LVQKTHAMFAYTSSDCADAFGLMAIVYEELPIKSRSPVIAVGRLRPGGSCVVHPAGSYHRVVMLGLQERDSAR
jgi:hypothetical protein